MSRIRTRQCHRVVGRSVALRARRCACQARPALRRFSAPISSRTTMPGCRPNFKITLLCCKKLLSPIMDYSKAFDLKSYIEHPTAFQGWP